MVDQEIARYFGPEKYARIDSMLKLRPFLDQLTNRYDPVLSEAGLPLAPEQMLPVAFALADAYKGVSHPETAPTQATVDQATGLTPTDHYALTKLREVISDPQIVAFKKALIQKNEFMLKLTAAASHK